MLRSRVRSPSAPPETSNSPPLRAAFLVSGSAEGNRSTDHRRVTAGRLALRPDRVHIAPLSRSVDPFGSTRDFEFAALTGGFSRLWLSRRESVYGPSPRDRRPARSATRPRSHCAAVPQCRPLRLHQQPHDKTPRPQFRPTPIHREKKPWHMERLYPAHPSRIRIGDFGLRNDRLADALREASQCTLGGIAKRTTHASRAEIDTAHWVPDTELRSYTSQLRNSVPGTHSSARCSAGPGGWDDGNGRAGSRRPPSGRRCRTVDRFPRARRSQASPSLGPP